MAFITQGKCVFVKITHAHTQQWIVCAVQRGADVKQMLRDILWGPLFSKKKKKKNHLLLLLCTEYTNSAHKERNYKNALSTFIQATFKLKWPTHSRKQSVHGNRQLLLNMSQHFCGNKLWMLALFKYHIISQCGLTLCLTTEQQETQNSFWSRTSISKFISSPDLTWPDPFSLVRTCTSKSNWESFFFHFFLTVLL